MIYKVNKSVETQANDVFDGKGPIFSRDIWPADRFPKHAGKFLRYVTLPPGSILGEHVHDGNHELFFVLSGKAEADDNGKTVILEPFDVLLTGNGEHHLLNNRFDEDFVMVSCILFDDAEDKEDK